VPKGIKAKDESGPLVGTWKPAGTSRTFYDFQPDGTMKCWTEGNERSTATYWWTATPGGSPKRMTWQNDGKGWEAVYELSGDSLTITYVSAKLKPPDAVGPHPNGIFEQLVRVTPAK
jgi:hypothetical protein